MIDPPPRRHGLAASTTQCIVPSTLTAIWRRQCSSVISSRPSGSAMPGVRAHDVDAAELGDASLDRPVAVLAGRHVAGEGDAAGGRGRRPRLGQHGGVPVERDHPGALVQESGHDAQPDALRGAGDDDAMAGKALHGVLLHKGRCEVRPAPAVGRTSDQQQAASVRPRAAAAAPERPVALRPRARPPRP